MTTKHEMIEENQTKQTKWSLAPTTSVSSITHEVNQGYAKTSLNKSSISGISHEICISSSDNGGATLHPVVENNSMQFLPQNEDDIFEYEFEASIERAEIDGYETDTESSLSEENLENSSKINNNDDLVTAELKAELLRTLPTSLQDHSPSGSSGSDNDEGEFETYAVSISKTAKCRSLDIFRNRLHLMPFMERRRLSQCKEEDEDDGDKSSQYQSPESVHSILNTERNPTTLKLASPPPPPTSAPLSTSDKASAEKFKDLERLRQQFMHKIDSINTRNVKDIKTVCAVEDHNPPPPRPPIPPSILPPALINLLESAKTPSTKLPLPSPSGQDISTSQHNEISKEPVPTAMQPLVIKGKFTVTKALEVPVIKQIKPEAKKLLNMPITCNAHTISFSCKYDTNYTLARTIFPQCQRCDKKSAPQPHLSKKFFDSSLVEIRNLNKSSDSLNMTTFLNFDDNVLDKNGSLFPYVLDEVWIKQTKSLKPRNVFNKIINGTAITGNTVSVYSDDEQDTRVPMSRLSSTPTEPNPKASRKANRKSKEEAKRQEKEINRREKEARKMERETARRLEREAAKLEKLNRNAKKISRSTERVAATPRSGSLERRRSGEDSPVLNQSTVHGIASPNRRPTIFDVFRASKRQKDKLLLDPLNAANTITVGGYDTVINNSTPSSGSGGVMNSMKVALQYSGLIGGSHHKQSPAVTITTAEGNSVTKSKYKDGSAHPHQGSDAQYYHTVTAVRRSDFSRSPMTKVMDLFRHRSNSAASEADKRKARAAAHQHQLAVQKYEKWHSKTQIYAHCKPRTTNK